MQNQSPFVKVVIWLMVFLMSIGFLALVVSPFLGGGSLFGNDNGKSATQDLLDETQADVRKDDCTATKPQPTGARAKRCREALITLASAYTTLANTPDGEDATKPPKDYQRNLDRALDAYKAAYAIDPSNTKAAQAYAAALRDQGKAKQSIPIWTALRKADPQNEEYLLQLGVAYSGANDTSRAIATYKQFIKAFPESGQIDAVKDEITALEEQAKQAASGAGANNLPITAG